MSVRRLGLLAGAALIGGALWWRAHPSACPYGHRWAVDIPHPYITPGRLLDALGSVVGQRVLEVGPGSGYYTLAVAGAVGSRGRLDIFDLQQPMLDLTLRRARDRGLDNVVATQGDARRLPYDDATFDAAFLVTVLGEIPDQQAALRELARVVRPGGRVVIGELLGDPHWVAPHRLRERARAAGLAPEERIGTPLAYFARLRAPGVRAID